MARSSVAHDGFLIPNAQDVADPILAEPDKIDFNTLANSRWGVVYGCDVTSQGGASVMVSAGAVVIDGVFVLVQAMSNIGIAASGSLPRFTSVVVGTNGTPTIVNGDAANDPVFQDTDDQYVLLATVFAKVGVADLDSYIVDKRRFVTPNILARAAGNTLLVYSYQDPPSTGQPQADQFKLTADGHMTWLGDTDVTRDSVGTLRITNHLKVTQDLTVGDDIVCDDLTATNFITGSNLRRSTSQPAAATVTVGSIWQDPSSGRVYVAKSIVGSVVDWQELGSLPSVAPPGTLITSLQAKDYMLTNGWYAMDGTVTVYEASGHGLYTVPSLFQIKSLTDIHADNKPVGSRSMLLPDLTGMVLMTNFAHAADRGGAWNNNKLVMTTAMLPAHHHSVNIQPAGAHTPTAAMELGGEHTNHVITGGYHEHPIYDPGHAHQGMKDPSGNPAGIVAFQKTGTAMLDGIINDRSHTYTVELMSHTMEAVTRIQAGPNYNHSHSVTGGRHNHTITCGHVGDHDHVVDQLSIGANTPIDITPVHFNVCTYIRG